MYCLVLHSNPCIAAAFFAHPFIRPITGSGGEVSKVYHIRYCILDLIQKCQDVCVDVMRLALVLLSPVCLPFLHVVTANRLSVTTFTLHLQCHHPRRCKYPIQKIVCSMYIQ